MYCKVAYLKGKIQQRERERERERCGVHYSKKERRRRMYHTSDRNRIEIKQIKKIHVNRHRRYIYTDKVHI